MNYPKRTETCDENRFQHWLAENKFLVVISPNSFKYDVKTFRESSLDDDDDDDLDFIFIF